MKIKPLAGWVELLDQIGYLMLLLARNFIGRHCSVMAKAKTKALSEPKQSNEMAITPHFAKGSMHSRIWYIGFSAIKNFKV